MTLGTKSWGSREWVREVAELCRRHEVPAPVRNIVLNIVLGDERREFLGEMCISVRRYRVADVRPSCSDRARVTLFMSEKLSRDLWLRADHEAGFRALYEGGLRVVGDGSALGPLRHWCMFGEASAVRSALAAEPSEGDLDD